MAFWHRFCFFLPDFFRNGFPNALKVRSRSSFLFSQWKFFELYFRTCLATFLQFKDFELYWGAVFFTTRRGVLERPFFKSILLEWFLKRKWNAWKNLEKFWCWTKVKSGAESEWFLFIPRFLREQEIDVWKNSLSERNFFVHVRLLKAVFLATFDGYEVGLW